LWAGYGLLAACASASALWDSGQAAQAQERLLAAAAKSAFVWDGVVDHQGWPLSAWQEAWNLWEVWSRLSDSRHAADTQIWFLALPLHAFPGPRQWMNQYGTALPFPSFIPEAWETWRGASKGKRLGERA